MKIIVRKLEFRCSRLMASFLTSLTLLAASVGSPLFAAPTAEPSESLIQQQALATVNSFNEWTARYIQAALPARDALQPEGVALVRQRKAAMLELLKANPAGAIELAVSPSVSSQLPSEVSAEL